MNKKIIFGMCMMFLLVIASAGISSADAFDDLLRTAKSYIPGAGDPKLDLEREILLEMYKAAVTLVDEANKVKAPQLRQGKDLWNAFYDTKIKDLTQARNAFRLIHEKASARKEKYVYDTLIADAVNMEAEVNKVLANVQKFKDNDGNDGTVNGIINRAGTEIFGDGYDDKKAESRTQQQMDEVTGDVLDKDDWKEKNKGYIERATDAVSSGWWLAKWAPAGFGVMGVVLAFVLLGAGRGIWALRLAVPAIIVLIAWYIGLTYTIMIIVVNVLIYMIHSGIPVAAPWYIGVIRAILGAYIWVLELIGRGLRWIYT